MTFEVSITKEVGIALQYRLLFVIIEKENRPEA